MTINYLTAGYPARLEVDYPEKLDRLTTFFRLLWIIPIAFYETILAVWLIVKGFNPSAIRSEFARTATNELLRAA